MLRTFLVVPLLAFFFAPAATAATSSVTVTVPVGATLTINGQSTAQMTGTRFFVTPDLAVGPMYRYIFVATFTWNGEEVTKKKHLDLTGGGAYTIDMMTGEPVKQAVPVEEPVKPVVVPKVEQPKPAPPKAEQPKPTPPKVEQPKPEEPKPAPKVETPKPETPKPVPAPTEPQKPKPPVAQPERQVAPKPREVKPKK